MAKAGKCSFDLSKLSFMACKMLSTLQKNMADALIIIIHRQFWYRTLFLMRKLNKKNRGAYVDDQNWQFLDRWPDHVWTGWDMCFKIQIGLHHWISQGRLATSNIWD